MRFAPKRSIKAKDTNSTIQAFEKAREQYEKFHSAQHEISQELCSDGTAEIVDVCENLASLYLQKQAIQVIQGLDNGTGMIFIQKVIQNGQICIQFQPDKHLVSDMTSNVLFLTSGIILSGLLLFSRRIYDSWETHGCTGKLQKVLPVIRKW